MSKQTHSIDPKGDLERENAALRAALGYYADPDTWKYRTVDNDPDVMKAPYNDDCGDIARKALAGKAVGK